METGFRHTTDWGEVWVHRFGSGPRLLIAQHGFGRDGSRFQNLARTIGSQYTLLAPDLPFHGATRWTEPRFRATEWQSVLLSLVESAGGMDFHFLGHSLGGRIGLRLFLPFQARLASFCLVAPDGLSGPYTRWIDRLPSPVVHTLSRSLTYPNGLLALADQLYRRRLIDSLSYQYLQYQLRDTNFRERLRGTLRSITDFRLRGKQVVDLLAKAETEITIFLGKQDRLIDADRIDRLFAPLANVTVHLAEHGHALPTERLASFYNGMD